jgi:hypothetical protein
MSVLTTKAKIEDITRLKDKIKDNWSLCNFYGKSEAELIVAQTIHACVTNHKDHGQAFSFEGKGLHTSHGNGLFDNRGAYGSLVKDGMFIVEEWEDRKVIYPTQALINRLDEYFAKKELKDAAT